MIYVVYEKASGRVKMAIETTISEMAQANCTEDDDFLDLSESDIKTEIINSEMHFVKEGSLIQRPTIDLLTKKTLATKEDWSITGLPPGTEFWMDDEFMGVIEDGEMTLTFEFPETYEVELKPPFPWIGAKCEVIVS